MKHFLSSMLLIGGLVWYSAAAPQNPTEPPPAGETEIPPSSSSSPTPAGSGPNGSAEHSKNDKTCILHWPMDSPTDNGPDSAAQQCKNICGDAVAKEVESGNTTSVSCISFNQPWQQANGKRNLRLLGNVLTDLTKCALKKGEPITGTPPPTSPPMVSGGNCTCNNPLIDELAETYVEALPIVANVRTPSFVVTS